MSKRHTTPSDIFEPNEKKIALPAGGLTGDLPDITITSDGRIFLNPVDFARRITQQIEADFSTLEGTRVGQRHWPWIGLAKWCP